MRGFNTLLVLWISVVSCQFEIGDPCPEDDDELKGVCTLYEECSFYKNNKKDERTYCRNGKVKVVCCPYTATETTTQSIKSRVGETVDLEDTPVEMNFLDALQVGIYQYERTVCRYDGEYPITCYRQEYPISTIDPERDPKNCPEMTWPEILVTPKLQIAWEACRNYSLEGSLCIPERPGKYYRDTCLTHSEVDVKIANGEPAQITQFPHMAVIGLTDSTEVTKKNKRIIWYGGGSLISEHFILSAAHVQYNREYDKLAEYAMLGATNKSDFKSGLIFKVAQIFVYPEYTLSAKIHDLTIFELDRRVKFSEFIKPICLNMRGLQIEPGLTIAGWGKMGDSEKDSPVLLQAEIIERPVQDCDGFKSSKFIWNSNYLVCAGAMLYRSDKKMTDTCQGDSGGPLMAKITNLTCSHVVVGVVSWGPKCGDGAPGVYGRVSYVKYLEWIVGIVWP